jgi:uncharacterized protein (UPF0335 family)
MARKAPPREAKIGDNSAMNADEKKKLDGYVRSIVTLETEKAETIADIKGIYESVKDANFSVAAVRRVVKARMMTQTQKTKEKAIADLTDVYMHALGMLSGTVFEEAARENVTAERTHVDTSNPPFRPADDFEVNPPAAV